MEQDAKPAGYASRNFVLLLAIIFFTTFASSMVSASPMPFLIKSLAGTNEAFAVLIGVLGSVTSVALITSSFLGGFLADRVGRKKVIVLGSGMLVPSLFACTIAPNVFWVIGAYFVQIFSISLSQPAFTALVADMSRLSSRGRAFGRFNLFWIGSAVPAPFVGGFLADSIGLRFPFIVAVLMAFVGLVASFGLAGISSGTARRSEVIAEGEDEKILMPFGRVLLLFGTIGQIGRAHV